MSLRITDVAHAAGVNKETLRYYERRGLLEAPERSPGGHRLYDDRAVQTVRIIKAAQRLGFTLEHADHHRPRLSHQDGLLAPVQSLPHWRTPLACS
jgi:DNA-binding transcriptional MerR regulator